MSYIYKELFSPSSYDKYGKWIILFKEKQKDIKFFTDKLEEYNKKYNKYGIYPLEENILKVFELVKFDNVKCVIWGQDPYPSLLDDNTPRAQGLSFSVNEKDDIPGSLKNIFKNIKNTYNNFVIPEDGDISYLCKEGVLLLNMCLIYYPYFNPKVNKEIEEKKLKSEYNLWLKWWMLWCKIVIDILNTKKNCIHLLWGNNAKDLEKYISSKYIFKSGHPSNLARGARDKFEDNKHFLMCNIALRDKDQEEINWNNPKYSKEECFLCSIKK